jgi:hypothetical protein
MKHLTFCISIRSVLLIVVLAFLTSSCIPYMKMNPPPDSDKPFPVASNDYSCWLHTASNMLAGAGYGNGNTVQDRANDIWGNMNAHYGSNTGGFIATALQWWLGSANNTWTTNPYTVVTVYGNTDRVPYADQNLPMNDGNRLRECSMLGLSISWPTGNGGTGGHAITDWGDNMSQSTAINVNPAKVRVTDSDKDSGGNVQSYTYDSYTNPDPGGTNEGNGWYFNYSTPHPFIKHIVTLSRTTSGYGALSVKVLGTYQIRQINKEPATDLHYIVGTDVNILTYRTWLSWIAPSPTITESQPCRDLTVDWNFQTVPVPQDTWITINTEFVESSWNSISYNDVHFTYQKEKGAKFPYLKWNIETPSLPKAESLQNAVGGYILGSFDVYDPQNPEEPIIRYRLVHQYLYNQSPEIHNFTIEGTTGMEVRNFRFTHSYSYPSVEQLWKTEKWMTESKETIRISDKPAKITIDWKDKLPYPEGDGPPPKIKLSSGRLKIK